MGMGAQFPFDLGSLSNLGPGSTATLRVRIDHQGNVASQLKLTKATEDTAKAYGNVGRAARRTQKTIRDVIKDALSIQSIVATAVKALVSGLAITGVFGTMYAVFNTIRTMVQEIIGMVRSGIDTVLNFQQSIIGLQAILASTFDFSDSIYENYKVAGIMSREITLDLARRSHETIATFEELQITFQAAAASGLFRFVRTQQEAVEVVLILSNAIAAMTPGMDRVKQLTQETRGFFQGTTRTVDQLGRLIDAMVAPQGGLKRVLKDIEQTKGMLDFLKTTLPGFEQAARDFGKSLEGVRTSLMTIKSLVELEVFGPLGAAMSESAFGLVQGILDAESELGQALFRISKQVGDSLAKGWDTFLKSLDTSLRSGDWRMQIEGPMGVVKTLGSYVDEFAITVPKLAAELGEAGAELIRITLRVIKLFSEGKLLEAAIERFAGVMSLLGGAVVKHLALGALGFIGGELSKAVRAGLGDVEAFWSQWWVQASKSALKVFMSSFYWPLADALQRLFDALIPEWIRKVTWLGAANMDELMRSRPRSVFEHEVAIDAVMNEDRVEAVYRSFRDRLFEAFKLQSPEDEALKRAEFMSGTIRSLEREISKLRMGTLRDPVFKAMLEGSEKLLGTLDKLRDRGIAATREELRKLVDLSREFSKIRAAEVLDEAFLANSKQLLEESVRLARSRVEYIDAELRLHNMISRQFRDQLTVEEQIADKRWEGMRAIQESVGAMRTIKESELASLRVQEASLRERLAAAHITPPDAESSIAAATARLEELRAMESSLRAQLAAAAAPVKVAVKPEVVVEDPVVEVTSAVDEVVSSYKDRIRDRLQSVVSRRMAVSGITPLRELGDDVKGFSRVVQFEFGWVGDILSRVVNNISDIMGNLDPARDRARSAVQRRISAAGTVPLRELEEEVKGASKIADSIMTSAESIDAANKVMQNVRIDRIQVPAPVSALEDVKDLTVQDAAAIETILSQVDLVKQRYESRLNQGMAIPPLTPDIAFDDIKRAIVADVKLINSIIDSIPPISPTEDFADIKDAIYRDAQFIVSVIESIPAITVEDNFSEVLRSIAEDAKYFNEVTGEMSIPPITLDTNFGEVKRAIAADAGDIRNDLGLTVRGLELIQSRLRDIVAGKVTIADITPDDYLGDATSALERFSKLIEVVMAGTIPEDYLRRVRAGTVEGTSAAVESGEAIVGELDRVAETVDKSTGVMVSSSANLARGLSSAYAMIRDASRMVPDIKPVAPVVVPTVEVSSDVSSIAVEVPPITVDIVPDLSNLVLPKPLLTPDEHFAEIKRSIAADVQALIDIINSIPTVLPADQFAETMAAIASDAKYVKDIIDTIPLLTPEADFESVKRAITDAVDYFNRVTGTMSIPPITLETNFDEVQRSIARDARSIQHDTKRTFGPFVAIRELLHSIGQQLLETLGSGRATATDIDEIATALSRFSETIDKYMSGTVPDEYVRSVKSGVVDELSSITITPHVDVVPSIHVDMTSAIDKLSSSTITPHVSVVPDIQEGADAIALLEETFIAHREAFAEPIQLRLDTSELALQEGALAAVSAVDSIVDKVVASDAIIKDSVSGWFKPLEERAADVASVQVRPIRVEAGPTDVSELEKAAGSGVNVIRAQLREVRSEIQDTQTTLSQLSFKVDPGQLAGTREELARTQASAIIAQAELRRVDKLREDAEKALEASLARMAATLRAETRELFRSIEQARLPGLQRTLTVEEQIRDAVQSGYDFLAKQVDTLIQRGVAEEAINNTIKERLRQITLETDELRQHLNIQEMMRRSRAIVRRFRLEREGVILPGVDPIGVDRLATEMVGIQQVLGTIKSDVDGAFASDKVEEMTTQVAVLKSQLQEIWFGFGSIENIIRNRVLGAFTDWVAQLHAAHAAARAAKEGSQATVESMGDAAVKVSNAVNEAVGSTKVTLGDLWTAIKVSFSAAKEELISGFAQAFANFIQGLAQGTSSLKGALGSLIIAIGNLCIALGTALLFMSFIPGMQGHAGLGIAAIAAGAALIALGSALGGTGPKAAGGEAGGGGEVMRFSFNQAMVDVQQGMATATFNLNQAVQHLNTMPPGVIVNQGNEENGGLANQVANEFSSGKNFGANLKMARSMQGA